MLEREKQVAGLPYDPVLLELQKTSTNLSETFKIGEPVSWQDSKGAFYVMSTVSSNGMVKISDSPKDFENAMVVNVGSVTPLNKSIPTNNVNKKVSVDGMKGVFYVVDSSHDGNTTIISSHPDDTENTMTVDSDSVHVIKQENEMLVKTSHSNEEQEDWNYDYDPEIGPSATCPNCGSDDVGSNTAPVNSRLHAAYHECYNCGHKSDWHGNDAQLAKEKFGHPNIKQPPQMNEAVETNTNIYDDKPQGWMPKQEEQGGYRPVPLDKHAEASKPFTVPKEVLMDIKANIKDLETRLQDIKDEDYANNIAGYVSPREMQIRLGVLKQLQQLLTTNEPGDVQRAVVYLTSLESTIIHEVPASVRQFLMKGYGKKSLMGIYRGRG